MFSLHKAAADILLSFPHAADERLRDKGCSGGCPNNYNLFHLSIPLSFMYLSECFREEIQRGLKPRSEA